MSYLIILGIAILLGVQTICFKEFNRIYMKNQASYFAFNFCFMAITILVFIISGVKVGEYQWYTILLGIIFGILFIVTILSFMKAMEAGPLSYTTLFNSFGLVIPVVFGVVVWNEKVSFLQLMGFALLMLTFYQGSRSTQNPDRKVNFKWLILCIIAFICNGSLMSISKWHQSLLPGMEIKEFLLVAFTTAAFLSFAAFLWYRFVRKQTITHIKGSKFIIITILAGITTPVGNQLIVQLAGSVPAVILFPLVNGGIVIISTLGYHMVFREKLSASTLGGLGLGILSLFLISIK